MPSILLSRFCIVPLLDISIRTRLKDCDVYKKMPSAEFEAVAHLVNPFSSIRFTADVGIRNAAGKPSSVSVSLGKPFVLGYRKSDCGTSAVS